MIVELNILDDGGKQIMTAKVSLQMIKDMKEYHNISGLDKCLELMLEEIEKNK